MTVHEDHTPRFEDIIRGLKQEMRDPIVEDVFEQVLQAEIALNRNPDDVTTRQQADVLEMLNAAFAEANIVGQPIDVSGRVRVAGNVMFDDDDRDALIRATLGDMGVEQQDHTGQYFTVYNQVYICGEFEVGKEEATDASGNPSSIYRIFLNLTPETAGPEAEGWLYAYPDDLPTCSPLEASHLKVNHELETRYPELLEQLDVLPPNCGKDKKILCALDDFSLTIDWSMYRRLNPTERLELLDYCERYITNRVIFDTAQYRFMVKGMYVGIDPKTNERFIEEVTKPREISGYMGHVRLMETSAVDDESEERVYLPMLEVFAPSPERGTGNEIVFLPVLSIVGYENTRNKSLFSRPTTRYTPESQDIEVPEPHSAETVVLPKLDHAPTSRQEQLEQLEARFLALMDEVDKVRDRAFSTIEDAREAQTHIDTILGEFVSTMPAERPLFEADGPGVVFMPVQVESDGDEEAETMTIKLSNLYMQEGDVFSPQRGFFAGRAQTGIGPIEGNEEYFGVDVQLIFADAEPGAPVPVFHEEVPSVAVYVLNPTKLFVVKPNYDTHITIPELERLRRCGTALGRIAAKFPDLESLPLYLDELQHEIETETQEFTEGDAERLRDIGLLVGGDEEATAAVVDALSEIVGQRPAHIVGPAYDEQGRLVDAVDMNGLIEGAVSTQPNIPVEEPMFVLQVIDGATRYVPLSTVERFRF